jgi:hypothetical protein
MSSEFNNPLDNSDVPIRDTKKSATVMFESPEQASEYKLYLETLKLLGEMQGKKARPDGTADVNEVIRVPVQVGKKADGSKNEKWLALKDLVPMETEFQRLRKWVITQLKAMDDETLRIWCARFSTDDPFTLSGRIAAYQLNTKKEREAFDKFNAWA